MKKTIILGKDENGKAMTHKYRDEMTNQPNPKAEAKTAEEIFEKHQIFTMAGNKVKVLAAMHEYAESVHASRKEEAKSVFQNEALACNCKHQEEFVMAFPLPPICTYCRNIIIK